VDIGGWMVNPLIGCGPTHVIVESGATSPAWNLTRECDSILHVVIPSAIDKQWRA